jgi:ribosomal protein L35AE/L33A
VRDNITVELRKLHYKELNYLYCSPNIIWMIKSRGMSWAGHVARIGERRGAYMVFVGRLDVKRPPGRTSSSGILRLIFRKCDGEPRIRLNWLRIGTSVRHL